MSKYSDKSTSVASLPVAVAKLGLRNAIRPFLNRSVSSFVAVVIIPAAGDSPFYEFAAKELLHADDKYDPFGNSRLVITSIVSNEDKKYKGELLLSVRNAERAVVFVTSADELPVELRLAADWIRSVPEPSAAHYRQAVKVFGKLTLTQTDADFLTTQTFNNVKMAMRPGRPLATAVRRLRLEAVTPASVATSDAVLRLEDMAGYGAAATWGLQLADDLAKWKRGELSWDDVDRGALLAGPPGCGKTTYARALAETCGVNLVVASSARWQATGHLGDFLKAMRESFRQAKLKNPCILLIDEFDSFGDRDAHSDSDNNDYKRQAVNGLLECLDPAEGREGVVVIGATNKADAVDPALLRPGRLEVVIQISPPDDDARLAILQHHLGGNLNGIDGTEFLELTGGWTGASIAKLARDARRFSRRRSGGPVTDKDLLDAMPPFRALTDDERHRIAVHEAGHAFLGVLLSVNELLYVEVAAVKPEGGLYHDLGTTAFDVQSQVVRTLDTYEAQIAVLLGGIAAETVVFGQHSSSSGGASGSDLASATDLATMLESSFGLGDRLSFDLGQGPAPMEFLRRHDKPLSSKVEDRLRAQLNRSVELLRKHRNEIDELAALLLRSRRVSGADVRALVSRHIARDTQKPPGEEQSSE